jgi:hypothetical protein
VQVFSPRSDQIVRFALTGLMALILFGAIGWWTFDRSSYRRGEGVAVDQPVPFSHLHHVGEVGLACQYCHGDVETAAFAGLPATEVCMTCHSQIFNDAPMLEPVRRSFATGTPLVWQRVHQLPDYVYFNHAVHVTNGVGCVTCHGRVDQMPLVAQQAPITMQWCLGCHRDPGPNLRPEDQEFAMNWVPRGDRRKLAAALMEHYDIHPDRLTDCYVCHR